MGDWDDDWESGAVTITKTENVHAVEDTVDSTAIERAAKEAAKKKAEDEAAAKKAAEEAAKKKKGGPKAITFNDQFNMPDNSARLTKLKEKKHQKDGIDDLFDGANHEFNVHLKQIELQQADDFSDLGQLLGAKLCDPEYFLVHVEDFFKNLLDATYEKLTSKELKEISTKLTVLLQDKQKEERAALGKKKAPAKGPAKPSAAAKAAALANSDSSDSEDGLAYKTNFNEDDFI